MLPQSLEDAKSKLSAKYLGKCGVHGVGIVRDQQAVRFDVDERVTEVERVLLGKLLDEARQEAYPFKVIANIEPRANTYQ